ncbi:hypothetical protein JXI42_07775 [bacterium]|nr:hypothetical protein [bacterium]
MKGVIIFLLFIIALLIVYFVFFKPEEAAETETEKVFTQPYQKGALKTKQLEAKQLLSAICQQQAMHQAQHGEYSRDIKQLQRLSRGKYYTLSIVRADANGYLAEARANLDNDKTEDVWQMDENCRIKNIVDDATQ